MENDIMDKKPCKNSEQEQKQTSHYEALNKAFNAMLPKHSNWYEVVTGKYNKLVVQKIIDADKLKSEKGGRINEY